MHYGVPRMTVSILQMLYKDFHGKVICGTELSDSFPIQTGVRQDACSRHCSLISAIEECPGKQSLEDCDFAGDIALLEKQHEDIQSKTEDLVKFSKDI